MFFLFIVFHIFYLHFFLVKRRKTFNIVLVSNPFLDWLYFFFDFGFWLSVRNGYILYLVFVFFLCAQLFFYFGIPFFIWPPFYIGLPLQSPFLFGPFYLVLLTKLFYFYQSSIRSAPAAAPAPTASSRPRPRPRSSIVVCSYLQNVLVYENMQNT